MCSPMFCQDLMNVFLKRNENEKGISQLLQKAYIDTRYKKDYSIKLKELIALTTQVKKLFSIFQKSSFVSK